MNFEENNVQSKVIAVPADGLAPSGARSSAGRSMTKFVSHIYTGPWWRVTRQLMLDLMYYKKKKKSAAGKRKIKQ